MIPSHKTHKHIAGRLIRFDISEAEARSISGAGILDMLRKEKLDLASWKPLVFDRNNGEHPGLLSGEHKFPTTWSAVAAHCWEQI
jgi:hypothetical protein